MGRRLKVRRCAACRFLAATSKKPALVRAPQTPASKRGITALEKRALLHPTRPRTRVNSAPPGHLERTAVFLHFLAACVGPCRPTPTNHGHLKDTAR
jgi:hypothetical protein